MNVDRFINCSRWSELCDSIRFHAGLADAAQSPTEFRFLNNSPPLLLGAGESSRANYERLLEVLEESPHGQTPLCAQVREVVGQITSIAPQLRAAGQRAVVVVATDGKPTDGDLATTLRPLQQLPVLIVVRMCTDEDEVVNYWNTLDSTQVEIDIDVLDDHQGEAKELYAVNSWLTYGEPLHRLREFGTPIKEMDMIDQAKLSAEQVRVVCAAM